MSLAFPARGERLELHYGTCDLLEKTTKYVCLALLTGGTVPVCNVENLVSMRTCVSEAPPLSLRTSCGMYDASVSESKLSAAASQSRSDRLSTGNWTPISSAACTGAAGLSEKFSCAFVVPDRANLICLESFLPN